MQRYIKPGIIILVLFILLFFGMLNKNPVQLNYYFNRTGTVPLSLILYLFLMAGVLIGFLIGIAHRYKLSQAHKQLDRQNRELRQKVEQTSPTNSAETGPPRDDSLARDGI